MMNSMPPGGQNPQAQAFLMNLLQALFGGSLGKGGPPQGGLPPMPGGMPGPMGGVRGGYGNGPGGGMPQVSAPSVKGPTADMPAVPGQSPYGDFNKGLPRQRY
jgi:hypothetical protein